MKNFSQCLLCMYVFGRTCKKNNIIISDDIYDNKIKCNDFKSINENDCDIDDSCCCENNRYKQSLEINKM